MAIDLSTLWNFSDPAQSERRFLDALQRADGDDAIILRTQIARTHGLRRRFAEAREHLKAIEPGLPAAGHEARARHALELGRTHASAAHEPESLDDHAKAQARSCFLQALRVAREGGLDGVAIDAIHMLAFVDTAPADQLKWNQEALALALASTQPAARAWEASLRNNLGCALQSLDRHEEALEQFERALALRERSPNAESIRVARWMVARSLRALRRIDEALAIQSRLERECADAGKPDPFVFEELEHLCRTRGDDQRADHYAKLRANAGS